MGKIRKFNRWLIAFIIIAQPVIDMIRKMGGNKTELFGIAVVELINLVLVSLIFLLTIITYKEKKKLLKWLWLLIPYLGYFILHYYNITQFDNSVYPNQTISLFTEFYYLFRMFIMPFVFIFSAYYSGIKCKELIQIFEILILIIAGSICVLNLMKMSFLAYDTNHFSNYSIFDWPSFNETNYQLLTTKGWFDSGNQISAILFITLPITLALAYNKRTKFNYLLLVLQLFAMLMLGTKVANVGCLLVLIAFFVIVIFKKIVLKKKINPTKWILLITIIISVVFIYSPRGYDLRHKEFDQISSDNSSISIPTSSGDKINEMSCQNLSSKDKLYLELFVYENQYKMKIPEYFLMSYPVKYNHNFWCYISKSALKNKNNPIDYREMKTAIMNQIYLNNDNKMDKFVGMGYTLNFIYTEEDYTYQFYSYGILGIILFFGPYFILLCYLIYKFFRNFKENFKISNILLIMSLTISLIVPYLSGHVFERIFPLYILAFVAILCLVTIKEKKIV